MTKDNEILVVELKEKTKIANETEAICLKETAEAQIIRDEVSEQRASCQKDLDQALPIQKRVINRKKNQNILYKENILFYFFNFRLNKQ